MSQSKPAVADQPNAWEAGFQAGFRAGRSAAITERCPHGFRFRPCPDCPPATDDTDAATRVIPCSNCHGKGVFLETARWCCPVCQRTVNIFTQRCKDSRCPGRQPKPPSGDTGHNSPEPPPEGSSIRHTDLPRGPHGSLQIMAAIAALPEPEPEETRPNA